MNERSRIDRGWFSIVIRPLLSSLIIIIVINFFLNIFTASGRCSSFGKPYLSRPLSSPMHVTRVRFLSVLRYPIMRNDETKTIRSSIFIVSDK